MPYQDFVSMDDITKELNVSRDRVRELLQYHRVLPTMGDAEQGRSFDRNTLEDRGILPSQESPGQCTVKLADGRVGVLVPVPIAGSLPDERYRVRITRKGKIKLHRIDS